MKVLIVEENFHRAKLWTDFLNGRGLHAEFVRNEAAAIERLSKIHFDTLIVNVKIENTSVLAITDFASYRNPDISIITVTSGRFFSDGSIFNLVPNARGCVGSDVNPNDLAAMIEYYASKKPNINQGDQPNQ